MQTLIETILEGRPAPPRILPEFRRPGIGRPDLAFKRDGSPARAFIELKAPGTSLDPRRLRGHDKAQYDRFIGLPRWAHCNFHLLRPYENGSPQPDAVAVPVATLDPATSERQVRALLAAHDPSGFVMAIQSLADAQPETPRNPAEIADCLARAARLIRHLVQEQCRLGLPGSMADVRSDFHEVLFMRAADAGHAEPHSDALFASAFAQTLVFGLLLAREAAPAATRSKGQAMAWRRAPRS
jgi:hypothetical protein